MKSEMKKQLNDTTKGWILVSLQFACIALLLFYSEKANFNGIGIAFIIFGLFLLFAAIIYMPAKNYSVHPNPTKFGQLVARGPYRYIRHPMYTSVILICLGLVINHFDLLRYFILLVLILTLITKLNFEEKLLKSKYPEYDSYKMNTKKLIPFLW